MFPVKKTLSLDFSPKIYVFIGEYQGFLQGFHNSSMDKKEVFAPVYVDYEGKKLIDMTQIREEVPESWTNI